MQPLRIKGRDHIPFAVLIWDQQLEAVFKSEDVPGCWPVYNFMDSGEEQPAVRSDERVGCLPSGLLGHYSAKMWEFRCFVKSN